MSNIEIGFEKIDNNLELNEPNLTIEITGLKTLNSFIGLEDTPLYYENGKFFKVDNNQIVYTDITWADIVGEIRENPNIELAIVDAVNDIHREVTIEIANNVMEVHNLDLDSHPFLKNIVDNNYAEISSQLENTKINIENSINELKDEVNTNTQNIANNTSNINDLNLKIQNNSNLISENTNNINNLKTEVQENYSELSYSTNENAQNIESLQIKLESNYSELNTLIADNTSSINSNTQLINETIENLKEYSKTSEFSNVAFSGDYNDLINQPNIPSIDGLATIDYVDQKVDEAIGTISGFDFLVVNELPPTGESGHIYLVANNHGDKNIYDEYIWVQTSNNFELIGSTEVDLTDYYTKEDTNTLLSLKSDTTYVQEQLNTKVNKENGKSLIADTEIERLAGIKNYDDTEIKSDISNIQNTKQDKLIAGDGIEIINNEISIQEDFISNTKIIIRNWEN